MCEEHPKAGDHLHDEVDMDDVVKDWGDGAAQGDITVKHVGPERVGLGKKKELQKLRERGAYCGPRGGLGGLRWEVRKDQVGARSKAGRLQEEFRRTGGRQGGPSGGSVRRDTTVVRHAYVGKSDGELFTCS